MFIDVIDGAHLPALVGGGSTVTDGAWTARPRPGVAKRVVDVAGALALLVAVSPLLLVIGALVVASDGRSPLFRQQRAGRAGRPFTLYKFRTMVPNAEARKADLLHLNERSGPVFKVRRDPRITRIGAFLRRTSLDELPQLVNVLQGHMSLVGPRPATLDEVAAYNARHARRLAVKPGLTGLWQVTARDEPDFECWVDLDLRYIQTWSLGLDLRLLALTPLALIRHPGR